MIDSGANYGWPVIEAAETRPDMATPITFFVPAVAPSGASFYRGTAIPAFRNQLFVATLRGMALLRVTVDGRRITAQERLRGEPLRPPARRGVRARRVPVLLHEQPGWQDDAGGGG